MTDKILFSLEKCMKCNETKKLISDREDIKIITYPHDFNDWSDAQINEAKSHDVFEELQRTAPIMWVNGEKIVGYLRIRKWLQDK